MFDKYILLNRKPSKILKIYIIALLLLLFILTFFVVKIKFTPYLIKRAEIVYVENNYYLKLNTKINELNDLSSNKIILIDNKKYFYKNYKINSKGINSDVVILYLDVENMPMSYKINNYQLLIKLELKKKGLIKYLKDGEEM